MIAQKRLESPKKSDGKNSFEYLWNRLNISLPPNGEIRQITTTFCFNGSFINGVGVNSIKLRIRR